MPLLEKGGKYVYGWSLIRENGHTCIPTEAMDEYGILPNSRVILMSSSRTSGGVCVTNKKMLERSKISNILNDNPGLSTGEIPAGEIITYKKRQYCWVELINNNYLHLPEKSLDAYELKMGDLLLSIRSSDIAFSLVVKGPLIERVNKYPQLPVFR